MNRLPISPLVARALEIGEKHLGLDQLSFRLGVPEVVLQSWRFGNAEIPNAKFLLLVDILMTLDPHWSDGIAPPTRAKRVLIVDDYPDTADSLASLLMIDGHQAIPVTDPRRAVAVAKATKPQLAMFDLRMPQLDGLQLARMFRGEPELKHTCLVAITAETEEKYRELTRQAGFDAYLKKPVDLALLRSVMARFGS